MRVAIVVPCFNEAHRLDRQAFIEFDLPGHELHFWFVNDGSTDDTLQVLESLRQGLGARGHVVDLQKNQGKAEAVRAGMNAALYGSYDFAGFWDADLATPLQQLPAFLDVFEEQPDIEMVFGARVRLLGREISRRPSRHYFGRVGATLISSTLGLAIYDTQCGAKVFRAGADTREVFAQPFLSRWLFDVEIIARFVEMWGRDRTAGSIYELPITVWRDVKGSKVRSTDFLRALKDLTRIHRAYRRR